MPIPKELMPQISPENKSSKKEDNIEVGASQEQGNKVTLEQGNKETKEQKNTRTEEQKSDNLTINQFNPSTKLRAGNLTMKKRLNWHYLATHVLPIFIILLLLAVGAIAAVPSWRNSFNKFIAKWSPKAEELQSDSKCSIQLTDLEKMGWESIIPGLLKIEINPQIVNIGQNVIVTVTTLENSGGFWSSTQGPDRCDFAASGMKDLIIQNIPGKIIKVTPENALLSPDWGYDRNVSWYPPFQQQPAPPGCKRGDPIVQEEGKEWLIPPNKTFTVEFQPNKPTPLSGYSISTRANSPYGAGGTDVAIGYAVRSEKPSLELKASKGYGAVNETPIKIPMSVLTGFSEDVYDKENYGKRYLGANIQLCTTIKTSYDKPEFSGTINSPDPKIKFLGLIDNYHWGWKDDVKISGKSCQWAKSLIPGAFTFTVKGTTEDNCYDLTATSPPVEVVSSYDLKVEVDPLDPDNLENIWKLDNSNNYIVPTAGNNAKPRAKLKITLKNLFTEYQQENEHIKLTFETEKTDKSVIQITDTDGNPTEEVLTDSNGQATAYIKSESTAKGKIKAEYIYPYTRSYLDRVSNENISIDETLSIQENLSEKGISFEGEAGSEVDSCTSPSKEQKTEIDEMNNQLVPESTSQPSTQINNSKKLAGIANKVINTFKDKINELKNLAINLFNKISNKAYSQASEAEVICIKGKEIYPGNNKGIKVKWEKMNGKTIDVKIPKYLRHLSNTKNIDSKDDPADNANYIISIPVADDKADEITIETNLIGYKNDKELKELLDALKGWGNAEVKIVSYTEKDGQKSAEEEMGKIEMHVNVLASDPKLHINQIEREVVVKDEKGHPVKDEQGNEKKELKTFKFPDEGQSPTDEQKKYMYEDKSDKTWKAKTYPGDKIYFTETYIHKFENETLNDSLPPLENVKLYFELSKIYYDDAVGASDGGEFDSDAQSGGFYRKYSNISIKRNDKVEFSFWVKLKDEIPLDLKQVRLASFIGDFDYSAVKYETNTDGKIKTYNYDIWTILDGKVTGPYAPKGGFEGYALNSENNKPVPALGVSLYDSNEKLIIGKDVANENKVEKKKIATNEQGDYMFEFDRNWFKGDKFKLKLIFDSRNLAGPDNPDIEDFPITYDFSNINVNPRAHITLILNSSSLPGKSLEKYDIPIRENTQETGLTWEYPTGDLANEAKLDAETYANFYYGRKILKEKEIYDTTGKRIDIRIIPGLGPKIIAYYGFNNNIYFNKSQYILVTERYSDSEFHEFTHYLQGQIGVNAMDACVFGKSVDQSICPDLLQCKCINHYGYANSSTFDSFMESMADVAAKYFDVRLKYYLTNELNNDGLLHATNGGLPTSYVGKIIPITGDVYKYEYGTTDLNKPELNLKPKEYPRDFEENASKSLFSLLMRLSGIRGVNRTMNDTFPNTSIDWLNNYIISGKRQIYYLGPFPTSKNVDELDSNFKYIFKLIENNKIKNFKELYDQINISNNDYFKITDAVGLSRLQEIFVLYGVYSHYVASSDPSYRSCYNNYDFEPNEFNLIGSSGNCGNYCEVVYYNDSIKNLLLMTPDGIEGKLKIELQPRPNRPQEIIGGSEVKFNFIDSNGNVIPKNKVKLTVDSPANDYVQQDINFEYEFLTKSDELIYFTDPVGNKPTKLYFTVEGSSDYLVIKSDDYWNAVHSTENYEYMIAKTFKIDSSTSPTTEQIDQMEPVEPQPEPTPTSTPTPSESPSPSETPSVTPSASPTPEPIPSQTPSETSSPIASVTPFTPTPSQKPATPDISAVPAVVTSPIASTVPPSATPSPSQAPTNQPAVTLTNSDTNQPVNKTSSGQEVVANAANFKNSETVSVYLGNKKIEEIKTIPGSDGFGIKVNVPDNAPLGKQEIKLVGDKGESASTKINITSNKYLNKTTLLLFLLAFTVIGFIYLFYIRHTRPTIFSY